MGTGNKVYLGMTILLVGILGSSSITQMSFAAPLTNEIIEPTNNLFSLESHYVVGFTTATTGTIKVITITFPAGFNIASTKLISASGIGSGGISVAGQTLTYTVNSPVSVPAGTNIIIDLGKIVNNAVASNTISITTKDTLNNIIDGPTTSPAFTLRTVGTNMLAGLAVTNAKIANGAVTNTKIPNGSINGTQIISGSIVGSDIASNTITGSQIASGDALTGSVSIDSPTFAVNSVNHRVGIGTTSPLSNLDVNGTLRVGPKATSFPLQGAYLGWNTLTGGTGETDFINNEGGGTGGFSFMNTPSSGSPLTTLVNITGSGNMQTRGSITWNNGVPGFNGSDTLSSDQGGSIELGNSSKTGAIPYIDFHYGTGSSQDYNVRLINERPHTLSLYGAPWCDYVGDPTCPLGNLDITTGSLILGSPYAAAFHLTDSFNHNCYTVTLTNGALVISPLNLGPCT